MWWDVKEPTLYSRRVGHEVPSVVAVLCVFMGAHHLNGCQNFNLLRQTNNKQKIISQAKCMKYFSLMVDVMRSWWSALDL